MTLRQLIEAVSIVTRDLIWGANVASLSLVGNPKKMREYIWECLFLYKTLNSKRGIPQRSVYNVLPCDDVLAIRLGNLKAGTWLWNAFWGADIINLCLICQMLKPKMVFEIGTFRGYTAYHFALNTPPDAKIYTLDLPKDRSTPLQLETTMADDDHIDSYMMPGSCIFEGTEVAPKIARLFGDSATFDYRDFYGEIDFFFIDGSHSYEYVRSDTLNALKCCHPGSIIAWHDFGRVGINAVSRWLLELSSEHDVCSVPGSSIAFMAVK